MSERKAEYNAIDTKEIISWLTNRVGTHFDGCWQYHPECMIVQLCNEIDRLRQNISATAQQRDKACEKVNELNGKLRDIKRYIHEGRLTYVTAILREVE